MVPSLPRLVSSCLVAALLVAAGCSSSEPSRVSTVGADAAGADGGGTCCPPDEQKSGSMHLGGWSESGTCHVTHDFWCTTNWRIEEDEHGCPAWNYDPVPNCTPGGAPPRLDAAADAEGGSKDGGLEDASFEDGGDAEGGT